jgi:Fungal chitosanase of glycosyl hydrolase group 75
MPIPPNTAPDGYTPPSQSTLALEGIFFDKTACAPRAQFYLDAFAAADRLPKYRKDPSNCKTLLQFPDGTIYYDAKMAIDADGSPRAKRLDPAGQIDTSHHFPNGAPFDAEKFPYIVLPLSKGDAKFIEDMGLALGDLALVIYKNTIAPAIFADQGPVSRIGEGSIHLHELLPVHSPWSDASHARLFDCSVDGNVLVFVFPNSAIDSQLTPANAVEKINAAALDRFNRLKNLV